MASLELLARLDRRMLFLLMALAVVVPYLLEVESRSSSPPGGRGTSSNAVERLEPGSVVLVSCDYDPGSEAEL